MVLRKIRLFLHRLLLIIYPEHCGFCGKEISTGKLICQKCAERVELLQCDGSLPDSLSDVAFDRLFYAGIYTGITRNGMLRLKKGNGRNAAKYLSLALAKNIRSSDMNGHIDLITYVPISLKKRLRLGFDHAQIIAEILSEMLGIPLESGLIRRKNSTKAQHSQRDYAGRRKLAKTVFTLPKKPKSLDGKVILLCDDILTSGATLSRCADILKAQGAAEVCAITLVTAGHNVDI